MNEVDEERELLAKMALRLRIMGHPTRLMIVGILKNGEVSVGKLVEKLEEPIGAVSHHLKAMDGADLVASRREGRHVFYSISAPMASGVCDVICQQIEHDLEYTAAQQKVFKRLRDRLQG